MCKVVVCVFLNGSMYFLILDAELRILADLIDDSDDDLCNNEFTSLDTNQGNNSYLSDKNHDISDNKDKEKNIDEESSSNKENVSSMFLFEKARNVTKYISEIDSAPTFLYCDSYKIIYVTVTLYFVEGIGSVESGIY